MAKTKWATVTEFMSYKWCQIMKEIQMRDWSFGVDVSLVIGSVREGLYAIAGRT